MNKTLLKKVCCMLSNNGLSKSFWTVALMYACHLVNRLHSSVIESKTLLKVWSEKVAQDYDRFRYLVLYMLSCQGRQVGTESEKMSVR